MIKVKVPLGQRSYEVIIGSGVKSFLSEVIANILPGAKRAAIVSQPKIGFSLETGIEQQVFMVPDGEDAKTLSSVEQLCSAFAKWGLTRSDVVIALGGGVVTDSAGFVAAIYHRGISLIHLPTTLLGQIDAAIGGKTGVNLAEGKNLVGAFWQPKSVICDLEFLKSLPEKEYKSGLGEMAKYSFLGGETLQHLDLEHQVAKCVEIKANFVSQDEREGGKRALLNYGHTLAHALEALSFDPRYSQDRLLHGQAVAIGIIFAAKLAHNLGRIDLKAIDRHKQVLDAYGLSTNLPPNLDSGELIQLMMRDKKATKGLTFVLDGPNGVEVVEGIDPKIIKTTLVQMGAK